MKTPDSELTSQISQVQVMVSELRAGFGSALQELSSIQHSDALLQKHIDQTREDCSLQIQELRGLVFSLKDDLQVALCEIRRVSDWQLRLQQDLDEGQRESTGLFDQHSHRSVTRGSSKSEEHAPAPPVCRNLRCYLQGFRPCQGQHSLSLQTECPWGTPEQCRGADCRIQPHPSETASGSSLGHNLQSPSHHGRRQQAAMELLQSERVYVSSLSQLQLHLGTALPPQAHRQELSQAFPACVQQLSQRHLLLRNTLEERVFSWKWQGMLGDVFAQLTSQDDGDFLDSYLTYVRLFPSCLLALRQSWSERPSTHLQDPAPGRNQQLLSLLSAPLSRIHSYLSHIQDLSRWTSGEHPDSYLLKLSERRLGCFLTQHRELMQEAVSQAEQCRAGGGCGDSFLALSLRGHAWQNQLQGRDPQPHTALDSHRSDACIASSSNLPAQKYRGDKKLSSPKTAVQTGQSPAARALNGKQPSLEKDCAEDLDLIGASVFDYHSAGSSDSSPKTVRASAMARLPKNCGIPRDRDPTDTSSFTKNCGIPRDRDPTDTSSFTKNCGIPRDRDPTDTSSFTKNCGIPRDRDPTDTSSFTKNCGIPRDRDPTDTSSFTKNCGIPRDRDPTDTSSFTNNCGIPRDRDPTDTESSAEGSEPQVIRAKPQLKLTSQGSPRIPASPCKAPHTVPGRESGEQPESQRAAHRGVRVVHSAPVLPSSLGQHSTNWKEMSKPETSHHLSRVSCKREKRVQKSERSKSSDAVYPAARVKLRSLQEVTMQNSQHCSLDHMLPKHKLSNYSVAGLGSLEECEDNTAPCSAV
ncbi:uncharacterized protein LOC121329822 isoform X2 [Polyodon spathula]|uniref:uncharacterized protein LOC121329822 isoform X2 n=1 Tax=Polyodon spathula TaxID=7913 RepID=UPI001B7E9187|nr:uncharacterized protein LOC121329822 isoform X2 [Polyodon spathula]